MRSRITNLADSWTVKEVVTALAIATAVIVLGASIGSFLKLAFS